ncbi:hypothetical protein ACFWIA_24720 [Streptomyces sp. NPDC127068]|uniref:hypothetical protein n=1 Tax=Streptomyces sp. NPDC127068 TaxID=3347127 RepID=UPI003659FD48
MRRHRPLICGAVQSLPPTLVLDALTAASVGDEPVDVMTDLRCEVEKDHPALHAGVVRLLYGSRPETVWTQWVDWRAPARVLVLGDCPGERRVPSGRDDWCGLFVDHPGRCSFDLVDPEHEAFMAANPAYRRLFAGGAAGGSHPEGPSL